jgi:hypothetical protein
MRGGEGWHSVSAPTDRRGEKRIEVLYDKRMRLYCGVYFLVGRGEECKIEIV